MNLAVLDLVYIGMAAFLVGFTKTSVGGVGILAALLMALAIPGKASPGVLLPMLIAADVMAVWYYRRTCRWDILLRLLPVTVFGVLVGYGFLWLMPDADFEKVIGWITLTMLGMDIVLSSEMKNRIKGRILTGLVGVTAGASSMVANAAGPVFGIYLLQMGLKKTEFVGTRSWFFLVMNLVKIPFAINLGTVTAASVTLNLYYLPVIILGGYLGWKFLSYINIQMFHVLIRLAVLIAAAKLILT